MPNPIPSPLFLTPNQVAHHPGVAEAHQRRVGDALQQLRGDKHRTVRCASPNPIPRQAPHRALTLTLTLTLDKHRTVRRASPNPIPRQAPHRALR